MLSIVNMSPYTEAISDTALKIILVINLFLSNILLSNLSLQLFDSRIIIYISLIIKLFIQNIYVFNQPVIRIFVCLIFCSIPFYPACKHNIIGYSIFIISYSITPAISTWKLFCGKIHVFNKLNNLCPLFLIWCYLFTITSAHYCHLIIFTKVNIDHLF